MEHGILIFVALVVCAVGILLYYLLRNPFKYPYFDYTFDVSGKRNVDIRDYIDKFICIQENWEHLYSHNLYIQKWKLSSLRYLESCRLKNFTEIS